MTPHIVAKKEGIAKTVLMPGDPLRAKFIAKTFLKDYKLVNAVRNMYIYTGYYNGKKITIAGSGMGIPSMGIYSYELFKFYDVDNIIRIGSSGSYIKNLNIYDIVLAESTYSDSSAYAELVLEEKTNTLYPSKKLNEKIKKIAKNQNVKIHSGQIHCSDAFYAKRSLEETIKVTNSICVDMESFALFANAKALNKNAACLLTISDSLVSKESTTPEEREKSFTKMMKIALDLA